jgi:anti-sigma regulatory factor (Ser/Thr protein kinase)
MEDGLKRASFPAEMAALSYAVDFVREGGQSAGLGGTDLDRLELVLEEIFLNVVSHAYGEGGTGTAEVSYSAPEPGALEVQVVDYGPPFNPLEEADPDLNLTLAERPIGGLGLFLIKAISASVSYSRVGDSNVLTFVLRASEAR